MSIPHGRCNLEVRVKPGAKMERLVLGPDGRLVASVNAPPIEGRANGRLIVLLSDKLDLPKSALSLVRGEHGRNKIVSVVGLTKEDVFKRLQATS